MVRASAWVRPPAGNFGMIAGLAAPAGSPALRIPGGGCIGGIPASPASKLSSAGEAASPSTPGQEPNHGLDQGHGGDFAAGQYEIPQRDLFERAGRNRPLVEALEPAAEQDGALALRQCADTGLGERSAPGRQIQRRAVMRPLRAASIAADATSARITMPGPPPAGVSSTVRCLPIPWSRMSSTSSDHRSRSQRLADQRRRQRAGKHLGEKRQHGSRHAQHGQCSASPLVLRHGNDDAPSSRSMAARFAGEGEKHVAAVGPHDLDHIAGAKIVDGLDRAKHPAFAVAARQSDQIGVIESPLPAGGSARARHEQFGALERFGGVRVGDTLEIARPRHRV